MDGLHGLVARFGLVAGLGVALVPGALAQPAGPHRPRPTTATATLNMLSVRPLHVDEPWDPKICIGCEAGHAPAPGRLHSSPLR